MSRNRAISNRQMANRFSPPHSQPVNPLYDGMTKHIGDLKAGTLDGEAEGVLRPFTFIYCSLESRSAGDTNPLKRGFVERPIFSPGDGVKFV